MANPIGFTFISCTCGLHVEFHLPISILISPVRKYKYKLREDSMSWICVHLTALKKAMMYNVYLMEYQSLVHSSVRQISLKYLFAVLILLVHVTSICSRSVLVLLPEYQTLHYCFLWNIICM